MKVESNRTYAQKEFSKVEQAGDSIVSSEFVDCTFMEAIFAEAIFDGCEFTNCRFVDSDLSLMNPKKSVLRQTRFEKSKLLGVNWTNASWGRKSLQTLLKSVSFRDCLMNYSIFSGLELPGLELRNCIAHEADFSEANLTKADFEGTDLTSARFRNTNLAEANLIRAKNYVIDPVLNNIKKARFSLPDAMGLLYAMDIVLE